MNKGLPNHSTRVAAAVVILCALAMLLPGVQAQRGITTAPATPYQAYLPLVGDIAPRVRLFLPLLAPGPAAELGADLSRAVTAGVPEASTAGSSGFVTRRGEELLLNGQPYTFVGTNVSYLAGPFFPESEAEGIIAHLAASGVQVIRVWVLPWNDLDRVERMLDLGRTYDIRFILVLQDFFGNLDGSCFRRYATVDLPHIRNVVPRFAQRPEVLLWELMNEPVCPASDSGVACWDALYKWAEVTSQEIKRLDPNHLVAVGSQRAGFDDQARGVFRRVHALDTIDLVSVHRSAGSLPMEMSIAHELGKPIYFGEVYRRGLEENCQPLPDDALERRAQVIADDLECSLQAGVDGYLLWQFAYGGVDMGTHIEYFCGVYDYFADDPVWSVLRAMSGISAPTTLP
jgi:hypothetical protein